MNIKTIKVVESENDFIILGLGDDSIMYYWHAKSGKWIIYKL